MFSTIPVKYLVLRAAEVYGGVRVNDVNEFFAVVLKRDLSVLSSSCIVAESTVCQC